MAGISRFLEPPENRLLDARGAFHPISSEGKDGSSLSKPNRTSGSLSRLVSDVDSANLATENGYKIRDSAWSSKVSFRDALAAKFVLLARLKYNLKILRLRPV